MYNPAITQVAKQNFEQFIESVREEKEPNLNVVKDIIQAIHNRDIGRQIALKASEIWNGGKADFSAIKKLLENYSEDISDEEKDKITSSIDDLIQLLNVTTEYKFNIPDLERRVGGIGQGNFTIIFARPESGKTAFWVHLVGSPNGFAFQGAKVHALINEEPAVRTQMRIISACTGMTRHEIMENTKLAEEKWKHIKNNITLMDTVDWSLSDVDSYCEKHNPDILIIDQLDKVSVTGTFARTDEKLRSIYMGAREISKRRACSVIAISQASAEAHNRSSISFEMMENSRTGKASEADLVIGIGRRDNLDSQDTLRTLCVSKNKITGYHGEIIVNIKPDVSRYTV